MNRAFVPNKIMDENYSMRVPSGIPSMFGFWGFPSFNSSDVKGGIPYPGEGEKAEWGHAIVAVGYDDTKKIKNLDNNKVTTGALLIRNSWGIEWGDKGYGWLPYDYILNNLVTEQLKSGTVNFPVLNPKGLESVESKSIESKASVETEEGKINTLIYPNPTSGVLKIEILNMPLGSKTEARLYDLSGNELIVRKNLELLSEITVSHLKGGIYILRVRVNEKLFDWKVIKE